MGETSRFEQELGMEHVKAARKKEESSHMKRHQLLVHDGLDNDFILKVVSYHRSALSRHRSKKLSESEREGGERIKHPEF